MKSISTPVTVQHNLEMANLSVNIFSAFEIAVFVMIIVVYPMLSWWTLYRKDGYRSLVTEFNITKRIVVATFFVIIAMTIIQVINNIVYPLIVSNPDWGSTCTDIAPLRFACMAAAITSENKESIIFYSVWGFTTLVFYSGLLKIIVLVLRKDFTFYLAKGYVNTAIDKRIDVEKMRYLGLSLKSYDLYLRKRLDLSIKNVSTIFSKEFVVNEQLKRETIEPFRTSFENEKLGPLGYLASITGKDDTNGILTGEIVKSFSEILKEYGVWLATVIPVVILVLQFALNPSK